MVETVDMQRPNPDEPKPFYRNPWIVAAIAAMITIPLLRPYLRHIPKAPPIIGKLAPFQFTDQDGKPFGLKQMRGHVYVVDFFFTSCTTICPLLTQAMKSLQTRYERHHLPIRLLSISVDPEVDTPERLRQYAKKWGADLRRWTFVTAPFKQVKALAEKSLMTTVGRPKVKGDVRDILHSSKLILVDQKGRIRGRPDAQGKPLGYFGTSKLGLDELFYRSQHTLWEKFHTRAK